MPSMMVYISTFFQPARASCSSTASSVCCAAFLCCTVAALPPYPPPAGRPAPCGNPACVHSRKPPEAAGSSSSSRTPATQPAGQPTTAAGSRNSRSRQPASQPASQPAGPRRRQPQQTQPAAGQPARQPAPAAGSRNRRNRQPASQPASQPQRTLHQGGAGGAGRPTELARASWRQPDYGLSTQADGPVNSNSSRAFHPSSSPKAALPILCRSPGSSAMAARARWATPAALAPSRRGCSPSRPPSPSGRVTL